MLKHDPIPDHFASSVSSPPPLPAATTGTNGMGFWARLMYHKCLQIVTFRSNHCHWQCLWISQQPFLPISLHPPLLPSPLPPPPFTMFSATTKHCSCILIILIAIVSISAAARTQPASSNAHPSFHTLPVPSSLKLRAASSNPKAPSHPASNGPDAHAPTHKLDANVPHAVTFGDSEPEPKMEEDFEEDEMDEGGVVGAVSRTFDPADAAEQSAEAGVWHRLWGQ